MSLFLASRLLSRNVLSNTLKTNWSNPTVFTSIRRDYAKKETGCYKFQKVHRLPGETHDDKNARIGRPLSPHLTIYRPQICSMTSILHRITGMVFSFMTLSFALFALSCPDGLAYGICRSNVLIYDLGIPEAAVSLFKIMSAAPFVYHALNGIRHLIWDMGVLVSNQGVFVTACALAVAFTAAMGVVTGQAIAAQNDDKPPECHEKN